MTVIVFSPKPISPLFDLYIELQQGTIKQKGAYNDFIKQGYDFGFDDARVGTELIQQCSLTDMVEQMEQEVEESNEFMQAQKLKRTKTTAPTLKRKKGSYLSG